uniref:Uncharacterized protein n=1 Tax=Strigamia maritima TaxID=126957 RepID=T1INX1_STRMM
MFVNALVSPQTCKVVLAEDNFVLPGCCPSGAACERFQRHKVKVAQLTKAVIYRFVQLFESPLRPSMTSDGGNVGGADLELSTPRKKK